MSSSPPVSTSRDNRDGLGSALAALALDIIAAATIILSVWNLATLPVPQVAPHLDGPHLSLHDLLTPVLILAPFFVAGWGRLWGLHAQTVAVLSVPRVRRLAWLSAQLALADVIAGILVLIGGAIMTVR